MNELEIKNEIQSFLNDIGNPTLDESKLKSLLLFSDANKKPVSDWGKSDLMAWLKNFKSISKGAVKSSINIFNRYYKFTRTVKGMPEKVIQLSSSEVNDCIDFQKLLNTVITKQQYDEIIKVMKKLEHDSITPFHIRNRVIFELSWLGLSAQQIKFLKKDDIKFVSGDVRSKLMIVKAKGNEFVSDDLGLMDDIRQCIRTDTFEMNATSGATRSVELMDSEYLIRPVKLGNISASDGTVARPQECLFDDFKKTRTNFKHIGIDLTSLRIEDIRRSKILYMFSLDHDVPNKAEHIAKMYDIKVRTDIYFYKYVSGLIYKQS